MNNNKDDYHDNDNIDNDPTYLNDQVYRNKKKNMKEIFISEKCLINSIKVICEENTFFDLAFQAT